MTRLRTDWPIWATLLLVGCDLSPRGPSAPSPAPPSAAPPPAAAPRGKEGVPLQKVDRPIG